jgi:short-subunit dehydrogenase
VAIPTDLTVASQRRALLEQAESDVGPIDILVNNAGIEAFGKSSELTDESIEQAVLVNLTAALLLTRAVLPGMLSRGRGHVVNIASGLGKMAMPFAVSYSATKHGLVGATHALRAEHRGSGVGFSVICPGFVRDDGMYAVHEAGGAVAPRMAGRATPEKVANAVVRAITHDRPEIMVNSAPMRPLVLLMTAFPSLHAPLVKSLGLRRWGERAAAQQGLDESADAMLHGARSDRIKV